jgi:hypothetical protein
LFDYTRKGFAESSNKYIKIPYEHALGIEFIKTRKGLSWAGFHHDFMGTIEKSGLVQFVKKTIAVDGFYEADVIINGITKKSNTFFPQHWTREQVISKILEAYDNFIAEGAKAYELCKDGKYKIEGLISEGIKIRMYVTKSGHITSAYPILT